MERFDSLQVVKESLLGELSDYAGRICGGGVVDWRMVIAGSYELEKECWSRKMSWRLMA